jgi:hypothetical protein
MLQYLNAIVPIITHLVAIGVYFIPLRAGHPIYERTLDEMHILGYDQKDVRGESTLRDVFLNDYWGRPMTKSDSHKSWRPMGILTFRWLKQNLGYDVDDLTFPYLAIFGKIITIQNEIFIARYVTAFAELPLASKIFVFNSVLFISILLAIATRFAFRRMVTVIIHAALAEMISLLACSLFYPKQRINSSYRILLMRSITKLCFALHPTHVEAVANGANRPHVLAIVCSILAMDCNSSLVVSMVVLAMGLMCSETAIFQTPAIILTMTLVHWKR